MPSKKHVSMLVCPNSGQMLIDPRNDSKVRCQCGEGTPGIPPAMQREEVRTVVHYVKFLRRLDVPTERVREIGLNNLHISKVERGDS